MVSRVARWVLLAAALGIYTSFALAHPFLRTWVKAHPGLADVWLYDFPLWPWFAFALLGGVLGWVWTEGQRRGDDDRRYFEVMSLVGVLCLAAFLGLEVTIGTTPHFFSGRDLVLNQHWNPGAVTCLWILGILFSLLPATYYLMKVRRVQVPWLVVLGQNALMLYFVHQVIVLTFLRQRFGVLFHSWWPYVLANALLLAASSSSPGSGPRSSGGRSGWCARACSEARRPSRGLGRERPHVTRARARPGATAPPGRAWGRCPTRARRPPCPPPGRRGG